jgi:intracellular multiplication protein IcmP
MASLLEMARSEGVLATAEFLWLKPLDRKMWYMLNSVGRQTATVEIAGAFAHWKTEMKVKRPLRTPAVLSAANALKESVSQILYVGKEESWRTSNVD